MGEKLSRKWTLKPIATQNFFFLEIERPRNFCKVSSHSKRSAPAKEVSK